VAAIFVVVIWGAGSDPENVCSIGRTVYRRFGGRYTRGRERLCLVTDL